MKLGATSVAGGRYSLPRAATGQSGAEWNMTAAAGPPRIKMERARGSPTRQRPHNKGRAHNATCIQSQIEKEAVGRIHGNLIESHCACVTHPHFVVIAADVLYKEVFLIVNMFMQHNSSHQRITYSRCLSDLHNIELCS